MRRHIAACVHTTWCTRMHMYVRVCARVCACVISESSILFKIFANSLITHTLYTRRFTLLFVMWDYYCLFLCASDVENFGVNDCVDQIAIVNLHLSEGVCSAL